CADVLGALVYLEGKFGQAADAFLCKVQLDVFGRQQGAVLLGQRGIGVAQDAYEIVCRQGIQFDPDGEAALKLGYKIRRLGKVEGARRDEQDVVSAYDTVLGVDGCAFNQRKQVALHALARHFARTAFLPRGDLVDLVQ